MSFADRFALKQAWSIAAEIARLHGNLQITRLEDPQQMPLLLVHDGPTGTRVQFDLPAGALWEDTEGDDQRMSWIEVFEDPTPTSAAARIAQSAGPYASGKAVPATKRTITYQVIAQIMAMKVDDAHTWQALQFPVYAPQPEDETLDMFRRFRGARGGGPGDVLQALVMRAEGEEEYLHEPYWVIYRDFEPAILLNDHSGTAYLEGEIRFDLSESLKTLAGDLSALAGALLAPPHIACQIAPSSTRKQPIA